MLDLLFLKYLSKVGKRAYWIGQLCYAAILLFYIFGFKGYSIDDDGGVTLIIGMLTVLVVWGLICLVFWREKQGGGSDIP